MKKKAASCRQVVSGFILALLVAGSAFGDVAPINSIEDALELAERYTGFVTRGTDRQALLRNVGIVALNDTTTPFINSFAMSLSIWRITFEITASTENDDTSGADWSRDFDVYLDSVTGNLLKIECNLGQSESSNVPELRADEAERQIKNAGESYLGIPSDPPEADFSTAFNCRRSALHAKKVVAQYILYSQRHLDIKQSVEKWTKPKPVWIISLQGTPPIEPRGGPADWLPDYTRNRMRLVINASTGRIMFSTTTPSIRLTPEDRERLFPRKKK